MEIEVLSDNEKVKLELGTKKAAFFSLLFFLCGTM